jgi:hypothetical protein
MLFAGYDAVSDILFAMLMSEDLALYPKVHKLVRLFGGLVLAETPCPG